MMGTTFSWGIHGHPELRIEATLPDTFTHVWAVMQKKHQVTNFNIRPSRKVHLCEAATVMEGWCTQAACGEVLVKIPMAIVVTPIFIAPTRSEVMSGNITTAQKDAQEMFLISTATVAFTAPVDVHACQKCLCSTVGEAMYRAASPIVWKYARWLEQNFRVNVAAAQRAWDSLLASPQRKSRQAESP